MCHLKCKYIYVLISQNKNFSDWANFPNQLVYQILCRMTNLSKQDLPSIQYTWDVKGSESLRKFASSFHSICAAI